MKNVAVYVSYTTHIASLHYIENFSTYVVSRRHLRIVYNDTSLHNHCEVKRSKGQQNKHRRFLERSNEVMEFSINIARSKGQGQTSFPAKCVQMHVLIWYCSACCARDVHVLRACCTSEPVQTGSNWFKPGKTQEKSAPSAVAAGYINRTANAIAITTVLRSLQSTSRCRDSSDTPSFVSIYYILSLFVSQSLSDLCTPISRITSNDEIHMFKMQQSVCKKLPFTSPYKNGV